MTLHIVHSNKVERLHDELCYLLENNPLPNPFDIETVVCPSKAMARWINIRFTQKMGIAAHYAYPMPSSWVWQLASELIDDVPEHDPLQRDLLAWRIFHYLENLQDDEHFAPLQRYLSNDADSTKRWSLANKIALVFERYQHFRPELIKQWSKDNKHEDWQGMLWQYLTSQLSTHRVSLLEQLGQLLSQPSVQSKIPQRVIFFSVSALPPLLLKNIQALAQHTEVFFFILSPSEHYWSDLISLKQQAKQRLNAPELNDYFTTGHELLASWGRQGQVFQDMLLYELDDAITQHHDVYEDDFSPKLLNQLQKSLFELSDDTSTIQCDDSIRFNLCHSPLRECEVLHDQCLAILENKAITPEDILVIVPNMEQYAVTIEAVFKKTPDQHNVKPFIPWNLSDSSLNAENPLIRTFLNVLTLPSSRFTVSDILSYLDCPELLQRFKLEESDKSIIQEYIRQAHISWGFDAEHKSDFNVPELLENTWQQAQSRFFNFYAVDEAINYNDSAPLQGFSSSRAVVIAKFMQLIDTLNYWREKLSYERTVNQWQTDLNQCIDALFVSSEEGGSLQLIRDAIDELTTQSTNDTLTQSPKLYRELVLKWLNDCFNNSQNNQRFFTGGITFCGMRPMRSVPFKVIVMLGMNEHEFPRHNSPIEFDLMAKQWRPGDLLISDEDRYLFLEAILCARDHLIISYCASSLKDNSGKEPSNLVNELCDYLDSHFKTSNEMLSSMSEQLSTQYAMHSYSINNYSGDYQSYNMFWCDIAQQINTKKDKNIELKSEHSESDLDLTIPLKRLVTCLKDPLKFYFNTQLNIRIYEESDADDDEPFDLDALQKWSLKDVLLKAQLNQTDHSLSSIKAQAVLPHGTHARAYFDRVADELDEQIISIDNYLSQTPDSIDFDINLTADLNITGQIKQYYEGFGYLLVTPSNFGSKPFIECWINHCVLCAEEQLKSHEFSLLNCKDKTVSFKVMAKNDALKFLLEAVDIMQEASQEPLYLLPKSSFFYQYFLLIKDEDKALSEALIKWHGNPQNEASLGEKENDFITLAFNQYYSDPAELFKSSSFKEIAQRMYGYAFKYCEFQDEIKK